MLFLIAAIGLCGLLLAKFFLDSALKNVPKAHWSAGISPLWSLWIRYRGIENSEVEKAHAIQGPIIQLGPDELSVNFIDGGVRTVYGSFEKHRWYRSFWNLGEPNMFSFENHRLHSDRRRLMSRVYSKSNLFSCPVLKEQNEYILGTRLQSLLEEHAKTEKPVEVFTTMLGITMDVVTAFLFGLSNSSNSIEDVEQRHLRLSQYQGRTPYAFFDREMQWAWPILAKFGVNVVPRSVDQATEGFEAWVAEACDASIKDELKLQELGQASKSPSVAYVLYKALSAERELQGPDAVQRIVASEMTDHIIAGHETSGVALTYLIYELCRNPPLQTRLQEEVKPLLSDDNAHLLPEFAALDALPFLQACTLEILRLYPPIVGPQARVTPPSGCKLGDIFVPGGLRVSARAPCLQKNPDVFADATTFRPDRWLAADGSVKTAKDAPELYRHWWAFGSGGRGCLGNHFAIHDIKIVAAYVYAHFSTGLVECGDMGQTDGYIGAPRGGRVMVKLEKA